MIVLEKVIGIKRINPVILFGIGDENIKIIETALPVKIIFRGELIKIQGEDSLVNQVCNVFYEMINTISNNFTVKKIFAFEPNPECSNTLKKTRSKSGRQTQKCLPTAISPCPAPASRTSLLPPRGEATPC